MPHRHPTQARIRRGPHNLGNALHSQGKLDEAIAEYRTAIRLKPDYAEAHNNLGAALGAQGKTEEAIAECRTAIRIKPDYAEAHNNLGNCPERPGQARRGHRRIPHRDPPQARLRRGPLQPRRRALGAQGKTEEAIAECRTAIRLKPDFAEAHNNLGNALSDQGKTDEAIAEYRSSHPRSSPTTPMPTATWACSSSGGATMPGPWQRCERATNWDRAGPTGGIRQQLGSPRRSSGWPSPSVCRQYSEGQDQPHDNPERLDPRTDGATTASTSPSLPAFGPRRSKAIPSWPTTCGPAPLQRRLRRGAGGLWPGQGRAALDEAARAKLGASRRSTGSRPTWLLEQTARSRSAAGRAAIVQTLSHWKVDTDLAGIREATDLAKLPEAEQKACRSLWAEVGGGAQERTISVARGSPLDHLPPHRAME